jgi:flavin reductase (DIM6/NTAB) family NADH-FMN oxidoreductase RutF
VREKKKMEIKLPQWYRILGPRVTVLVSTVDKNGNSNAAPVSFISPLSAEPPLVMIALRPERHTLANIRETKDFVLNLPQEELINQVMICSKPFPQGVSEIKEAKLTEIKAKTVSSPRIAECLAWIECKFSAEHLAGDHQLIIGEILIAEIKDEFYKEFFLCTKAKLLLHLTGKDFAIPGKIVHPSE